MAEDNVPTTVPGLLTALDAVDEGIRMRLHEIVSFCSTLERDKLNKAREAVQEAITALINIR